MNKPDRPLPDLLALVGHTAGGKTTLAAYLAQRLNGEVISADSRQVYRGMDIGTGKDLADYQIGEVSVKYHLINVTDAGEKYSLFDFKRDFHQAYNDIRQRGRVPILCGGTGLYTEAILKGYSLAEAPVDAEFRKSLEDRSDLELVELLESLAPLHNQSDTTNRDRLIRAIEVAGSNRENPGEVYQPINSMVFCLTYEAEIRRQRITERLTERLKNGMIEEVQNLLRKVKAEDLIYYGLEYKYLTQYCIGEISYDQMFNSLNTAIHQFAKRQMTWFRRMEKQGLKIHWIDGRMPVEKKVNEIRTHFFI